MADTTTTILGLTKPEVNASADTWGTKLNADLDILDGLFSAGPALKVANGGTGATTAANARTNLGLGTLATQNASAAAITGGSVTGITDLAVADGGTGSSTAVGARSNLGAAGSGANTDITSVQLDNAGLKVKDTLGGQFLTIAPGSDLSANRTLSIITGDADRTLNLAGNFTVSAATSISAFGATLVDDADATAARTTLGLGALATRSTVGTAQIDDGAVAALELATNAVTTIKITDANVTTAKLADAAITTAKLADNAVTGTKIAMGSDARGDLMFYNGTDYARLAAGTAGQVLVTNGTSADPAWSDNLTHVHLGTIATTSGSTATLSSLVLTGYKKIVLVWIGLSATTYSGVTLYFSDGTSNYAIDTFENLSSDVINGETVINLENGFFSSHSFNDGASTYGITTTSPKMGRCRYSTATTTITVGTSGTFDAGSVKVYGVK